MIQKKFEITKYISLYGCQGGYIDSPPSLSLINFDDEKANFMQKDNII